MFSIFSIPFLGSSLLTLYIFRAEFQDVTMFTAGLIGICLGIISIVLGAFLESL